MSVILQRLFSFLLQKVYRVFFRKDVDVASLYSLASTGCQRIPNTVFQTWKRRLLPSFHARGVKRFRDLNHDYSFKFFDDLEMANYMESRYAGHPILDVFRRVLIPTARVDIWRYCILFREGGIYCDIDSALAVPFRELLKDDPSEMISFEGNKWKDQLEIGRFASPLVFRETAPEPVRHLLDHPDNVILNWLLCFEKGHPILEETLRLIVSHFDFYKGKVFSNMWKAVIHFTGPLVLTQAAWVWLMKARQRPTQCGIDFCGKGIFKLPGAGYRDRVSPHFSSMTDRALASE